LTFQYFFTKENLFQNIKNDAFSFGKFKKFQRGEFFTKPKKFLNFVFFVLKK